MNGLPLGKGEGDTAPKETQLVTYRAIKDPRICHMLANAGIRDSPLGYFLKLFTKNLQLCWIVRPANQIINGHVEVISDAFKGGCSRLCLSAFILFDLVFAQSA